MDGKDCASMFLKIKSLDVMKIVLDEEYPFSLPFPSINPRVWKFNSRTMTVNSNHIYYYGIISRLDFSFLI